MNSHRRSTFSSSTEFDTTKHFSIIKRINFFSHFSFHLNPFISNIFLQNDFSLISFNYSNVSMSISYNFSIFQRDHVPFFVTLPNKRSINLQLNKLPHFSSFLPFSNLYSCTNTDRIFRTQCIRGQVLSVSLHVPHSSCTSSHTPRKAELLYENTTRRTNNGHIRKASL